MNNDVLKKVTKEMDMISGFVAVWIILKGCEMAGRITVRYAKTGGTVFVTFHMFPNAEKYTEPVYGMKRMTGWGYNKTGTGIAEIMIENRERLKQDYGIEMSDKVSDLLNHWERYLESGGFRVLRAV